MSFYSTMACAIAVAVSSVPGVAASPDQLPCPDPEQLHATELRTTASETPVMTLPVVLQPSLQDSLMDELASCIEDEPENRPSAAAMDKLDVLLPEMLAGLTAPCGIAIVPGQGHGISIDVRRNDGSRMVYLSIAPGGDSITIRKVADGNHLVDELPAEPDLAFASMRWVSA